MAEATLQQLAGQLSKRRKQPLHIGTALMPHLLDEDQQYAAIADAEFNLIVPEHHQKWEPLLVVGENGAEQYDFQHADKVVQWARSRGKAVKGHCLVWHVTSPKWIETCSPARLKEATYEHIKTVMNHYLGQIDAWDVVNEALNYDASGRMADTAFSRKLGPGYTDECFRVAHQYDPNARLVYNDNKVEGAGLPQNRSAKADALYDLARGMLQRGVPLHTVGLQAHFDASGTGLRRTPTPHSIARQIRRLGALGLTVNISEMDVRTANLPGASIQQRDEIAAQICGDTLAAALSEPAFEGITYWGFTDKYSWCHSFYPSQTRDRPLLWDEGSARKPCYFAVANALQEALKLCEGGRDSHNLATIAAVADSKQLPAVLHTNEDTWGSDWMLPEPSDSSDTQTDSVQKDQQNSSDMQQFGAAIDEPDWSAGGQAGSTKPP